MHSLVFRLLFAETFFEMPKNEHILCRSTISENLITNSRKKCWLNFVKMTRTISFISFINSIYFNRLKWTWLDKMCSNIEQSLPHEWKPIIPNYGTSKKNNRHQLHWFVCDILPPGSLRRLIVWMNEKKCIQSEKSTFVKMNWCTLVKMNSTKNA